MRDSSRSRSTSAPVMARSASSRGTTFESLGMRRATRFVSEPVISLSTYTVLLRGGSGALASTTQMPWDGRSSERREISRASASSSILTRTSLRRPIGRPNWSRSWAVVRNREPSRATQCGSMWLAIPQQAAADDEDRPEAEQVGEHERHHEWQCAAS